MAETICKKLVVGCFRMRSCTKLARERSFDAARAALDAGLEAFEITLDSPYALELLDRVQVEYPHVIVGCGTAMDRERVRSIAGRNLHFATSPTRAKDVGQWLAEEEKDILFIPGVATPTEAHDVTREDGWPLLKVYPAKREFLVAMKDVMPEVKLLASGGLGLENLEDMIRSGADAVVMGSALFDRQTIARGDLRRIEEGVRRAILLARDAWSRNKERHACEEKMWE